MSFGVPHGGLGQGSPAMDEITISRPLSPEEAVKRLQTARRAVIVPILAPILGGALLLVMLVVGLLKHWSIAWVLGVGVGFAVIIGGAVALGWVLGNDVLRRQARYELGDSGVLTVTWSGAGAQVSAANFQRSFRYQEVQWIREVGGYVILKFAMQWHASPYVMAFPPDFVPAQARQQLAAAGVVSK